MLSDVIEGLCAMGYSKEEARACIKDIDVGEKSVEDVLREVLRHNTK